MTKPNPTSEIEDLDSLLIQYKQAYNTAFNEVDPHNTEKWESSYIGTGQVMKRSRGIEEEIKTKINNYIASQTNTILDKLEDKVVDSDRPYTNENDRKVANHYKLQLLKALKQMRNE